MSHIARGLLEENKNSCNLSREIFLKMNFSLSLASLLWFGTCVLEFPSASDLSRLFLYLSG